MKHWGVGNWDFDFLFWVFFFFFFHVKIKSSTLKMHYIFARHQA